MTTNASNTLRTLGNSGLALTAIGFGAWAIGGGNWEFAWGPQDDHASIAAIHRALELGVNWIDTAAIYGLGHSEEVVGRAVKSWPGAKPLVFTKCSMRWHEDRSIYRSLKAASVIEEAESSLRRLGVEAIDLYQSRAQGEKAGQCSRVGDGCGAGGKVAFDRFLEAAHALRVYQERDEGLVTSPGSSETPRRGSALTPHGKRNAG